MIAFGSDSHNSAFAVCYEVTFFVALKQRLAVKIDLILCLAGTNDSSQIVDSLSLLCDESLVILALRLGNRSVIKDVVILYGNVGINLILVI